MIKKYFDSYRQEGRLPPEIEGKVTGRLFPDIDMLKKWRSWRTTNLSYEDKSLAVSLSGALDDCLIEDNLYIPLDYKTRGYEPNESSSEYYQTQLDCYSLILKGSGYEIANIAYLLYYWPLKVMENGIVKFQVEPVKVETNIESAKETVRKATLLLYSPIPEPGPDCEYCKLAQARWGE